MYTRPRKQVDLPTQRSYYTSEGVTLLFTFLRRRVTVVEVYLTYARDYLFLSLLHLSFSNNKHAHYHIIIPHLLLLSYPTTFLSFKPVVHNIRHFITQLTSSSMKFTLVLGLTALATGVLGTSATLCQDICQSYYERCLVVRLQSSHTFTSLISHRRTNATKPSACWAGADGIALQILAFMVLAITSAVPYVATLATRVSRNACSWISQPA